MSHLDINHILADQLRALAQTRNVDMDTLLRRLLASDQLNSISLDILLVISEEGILWEANPAVEVYGGRIDFESEVDKGTTFWVNLPAQRIAPEVTI